MRRRSNTRRNACNSARRSRASALSCDAGPAGQPLRSLARFQSGDEHMATAAATVTTSPAAAPTASPVPALTLANVVYEKKAAIAYVTVNRPKVLNALNTPTWKDLRTAFEDARDDAAVRGVILTGAGNKAFIAGADISELAHVAAFQAEHSS